MSNVVNLLTKEQVQTLQEVCDIMDGALSDNREVYLTKIINEHGEQHYMASREEYLASIMDYVLTAIGCVFPQIE